jgi:hypothetical protein
LWGGNRRLDSGCLNGSAIDLHGIAIRIQLDTTGGGGDFQSTDFGWSDIIPSTAIHGNDRNAERESQTGIAVEKQHRRIPRTET